jgi:hypothetical protein
MYKNPKYGMVYGEIIRGPLCRLAWAALAIPKANTQKGDDGKPQEPKYEATFIFSKDGTEGYDEFAEGLGAMVGEMLPVFNEGRSAKFSDVEYFQDGDGQDPEKYPFYVNSWFIQARNKDKPATYSNELNEEGSEWLPKEADELKGGNLVIPYLQPFLHDKGLKYKLIAVRFVQDDGVKFASSGGGSRNIGKLLMALDSDVVAKVAPKAPVTEAVNPATEGAAVEVPAPKAPGVPKAAKASAAAAPKVGKAPVAQPIAVKGVEAPKTAPAPKAKGAVPLQGKSSLVNVL